MTLSAILTNRLNPSSDFNDSRWEMLWQKSLARVEESTSNACRMIVGKFVEQFSSMMTDSRRFNRHSPHPCRQGNKLCGRFVSSCAGWLPLRPDEADTFAGHDAASSVAAAANRWQSDVGASARTASIPGKSQRTTHQIFFRLNERLLLFKTQNGHAVGIRPMNPAMQGK